MTWVSYVCSRVDETFPECCLKASVKKAQDITSSEQCFVLISF
jgi:hypothetical protein